MYAEYLAQIHANSMIAASGYLRIYEPWLVNFVGHALGVLDSSDSQNSSPPSSFSSYVIFVSTLDLWTDIQISVPGYISRHYRMWAPSDVMGFISHQLTTPKSDESL